jgi:hypothetical protein
MDLHYAAAVIAFVGSLIGVIWQIMRFLDWITRPPIPVKPPSATKPPRAPKSKKPKKVAEPPRITINIH